MKSGKVPTMDTQVLFNVPWTHEVVFTVDGQPCVYANLSVSVFVSGYVKLMDAKKPTAKALMATHLTELMADAELYGWEVVQAFHAVWQQQLEQYCASWEDQDMKMAFHRSLMWHRPTTVRHPQPTLSTQQKKPAWENTIPFNVLAKPGPKACI